MKYVIDILEDALERVEKYAAEAMTEKESALWEREVLDFRHAILIISHLPARQDENEED